MDNSSARGSDIWRVIPTMLGALLVMLLAVDAVLALQPSLLKDLSTSWQGLVRMQPVLVPSANILAATLAVTSVVISSAVLFAFSRAPAGAAHVALTSVWVAACMLVVASIHTPLPLPTSTPTFAALCGVLYVGAGTLLRQGSSGATLTGWAALALPFAFVIDGFIRLPTAGVTFRDASGLIAWLAVSATGVSLVAYAWPRRSSTEVEGLEGVDAVESLFEQVERAERAEAKVAELQRQLNAAYPRRHAS
ncbi:MAG TPA: hypothetical protein VJV78_16670 [Polyangiales bacterium]|nr:hypothetical protein [Polyangiales bacterium]